MGNLPKLSYVLLSYNREKYIRPAIESAFAQDYEGELEYIFSDDCSTDRTFEIIKECVAAYKGNRRVVVTQTPHNVHLAGNINHALQFASGDFIVRADDDDISCRNRCALVAKAIQYAPNCSYVLGGWQAFTDKTENEVKEQALRACPIKQDFRIIDVAHTAKMDSRDWGYNHQAWKRTAFTEFGPLSKAVYFIEDYVTLLRANVLGVAVITDELFAYIRKGEAQMSTSNGARDSSTPKDIMAHELSTTRAYTDAYHPLLEEFDRLIQRVPSCCEEIRRANIINYLNAEREKHIRSYPAITHWQTPFLKRLERAFKQDKITLFSLIRSLPLPVFAFIISIVRKIRK